MHLGAELPVRSRLNVFLCGVPKIRYPQAWLLGADHDDRIEKVVFGTIEAE